MTITVLLADDHEIMRKAIANLLKGDPVIQLVAEAASFSQTMQLTGKLHPQIVVMDLHMRDEKDVTPAQVKSALVGSRLLAISIWNDEQAKALADSFGAVTLLDKPKLADDLIPAIKLYAKE
jgi:DNA-binding NarL/FixJ family response regulator